MPKGDRYNLKADPEDGTTQVSNLLLEALALARLSGHEKGALLYLIRKTYGWVGPDGIRLKKKEIPLSEWAKALKVGRDYASRLLAGLCDNHIIMRHQKENWQNYVYSLNTHIAEWNSGCIDLQQLSEMTTQQLSKSTTPLDTNSDSPKEILNKGIKSMLKKEGRAAPSSPNSSAKKAVKPGNPLVKEISTWLEEERGYVSPCYGQEAQAIKWMLDQGYSDAQIKTAYLSKAKETFWGNKLLTMANVKKDIGVLSKKSALKEEFPMAKAHLKQSQDEVGKEANIDDR